MSQDEDEEKKAVKERILGYSVNVKNFAKWFAITDVKRIDESYTAYKVVYRFLPKDLNDSIKEIIAWKRFSDFKDLNEHMQEYHVSLHRRDKFPEFPRPKFFGRFDEKTVEERRQCSLRLLQFIGSQAHLYKHPKFIDFLAEGSLNEQATLANESQVLVPKKLPCNESGIVQSLHKLGNNLTQLIGRTKCESINMFLNKSLRYINSAISNEDLEEHFASYKLLNSAAKNLENFLNDDEQSSGLDSGTKQFIGELIEKLRLYSEKIESLNCLDLDNTLEVASNQKRQNEGESALPISASAATTPVAMDSNIANDWILSDFNLSSNDFKSELNLITGSLFDLNFAYQLCKVLNPNCLLMKSRTDASQDPIKYVLKNLRKSSSPNVNSEIQVPTKRVPYMCRLIKYFETDTTIFLLLEYIKLGRLFQHLQSLLEQEDVLDTHEENLSTSSNETTTRTARKSTSPRNPKAKVNRRKSFNLNLNNSFTSLESSSKTKRRSLSFRTSNRVDADLTSIISGDFKNTLSIDEPQKTCKMTIGSNSSSNSSSDSIGIACNINKIEMSKSDQEKTSRVGSDSGSSTASNTEKKKAKRVSPIVFLSNKLKSSFTRDPKPIVPVVQVNDQVIENKPAETAFVTETRKWLAQLLVCLKSLHDLNIICKDIRPDNLLLSDSKDLVVTFFSKWNLVDERLSSDALSNFYVAPELTGLVNYPVSEASDWWSFGVIAYELLTLNKFSEYHTSNQLYADNILFPSEFKNESAKDLIRQIICWSPTKRLTADQIQAHEFFKGIDWTCLGSSI